MRESDWKMVREGKNAHRDRVAALPFEEKMQRLERLHARARALRAEYETVQAPRSGVVSHVQNAAESKAIATIRFFGVAVPLASAMGLPQPGRGR